jgi:hypothetical protein
MKRICILGLSLCVACAEDPSKTSTDADDTPEVDQDSGADGFDDGATWHKDVAPLIDQNCAGCHNPSGISFDLTDYENTALFADALVGSTESGQMPPWPPNRDCRPLMHERTLTDAEKAILREWAERDTPEGDPDTAPELAEVELDLPDADLTLSLPEPYTPTGSSDDYRCFVIDPGLTETARITGFQVHPDNAAIVHHVLVYTDLEDKAAAMDAAEDGPGYTCFGGPGFNETAVVGAWAPGSPGYRLPHNTAVSVDPGTALVVQVHYSPAGDPGGNDQSSVSFDLAEPDEDKRSAFFFPFVDTRLAIPPGAQEHVEGFTTTLNYGIDLQFFGGGPHLHRLGTSISVHHRKQDEDEFDCLMDIPRWDFNYQEIYFLEEPVTLRDGDELTLRCVYDNSDSNPHATGETVHWGDATNDEMCLIYALAGLGG